MEVRTIDPEDRGYVVAAWREAHKTSPGCDRAPWWAYRREYGDVFKQLVNDESTVLLGAYEGETLLGFLVMTPGKRVQTLHWCQVKLKLDGVRIPDRLRIFDALVDAAKLGRTFVYTLRGPRLRKGTGAKSLDEILVAHLRARGRTATYVPLKEWLK